MADLDGLWNIILWVAAFIALAFSIYKAATTDGGNFFRVMYLCMGIGFVLFLFFGFDKPLFI